MLVSFVLTLGCAFAATPEKWSRLNQNDIDFDLKNEEDIHQRTSVWSDSFRISTHRDLSGTREVRVDSGVVRGRLRREHDGEYFAFLGIPYAAPPTGRNRFMPPGPPQSWNNVFDANRTVQCPQQGVGDEDCLVLNVFAPTSLPALLPVLVYIHGGSFIMGSGPTQGLSLLVNQNFIVVTLNYRLGVLGFLCLGTEEALGNAGLKDQLAALQWVERNIGQFGGDPSQVTLYGVSAGAASVHYHVLSSDGLFKKAIIESGSATSVWAVDSDPINTAKRFLNILKPSTPVMTLEELVHYLRSIPADKLSQANYNLYQSLIDGSFGFVPCVENKYNLADALIVEPPLEILEKFNYTGVPIMFLYASLEGLFLRSPEYYELDYKYRMNQDFASFIPADLLVDKEPIKKTVLKKLKRQYFGSKGIVDDKHLLGYLNYFGDYLILHGLLNSAEKHAGHLTPVYLMEFAYKSQRGKFEQFYEYINTAGHGDFARNVISTKLITSRSDKLTAHRLSQLIANFAKFSNPTPEATPLLPVKWLTVEPANLMHLYLDQEFSVRQGYTSSRKRLWDELYAMYRKPVKPVNPFVFV